MKKYIAFRIIFIGINAYLVGTILFFGLTYANIYKYSNLSLQEISPIAWRLYKSYITQRLLYGNWGLNNMGHDIREIIVPKCWISLKYNLIALAVYFPLGVIIGTISAYFYNSILERFINLLILIFGSIPTYILTFLLIIILGFQLQMFPPHYSAIPQTPIGKLWGLGIPIIALGAAAISKISRVIRDELLDSMQSEYSLLCITKGLSKRQIYLRHLLRNSITGVLPVMMDVFLLVLMGSFFVELAFGIRGVAEVLYDSLVLFSEELQLYYILIDVNTIVIISTFYMVVSLLFSLIVDVSYQLIDPRINILPQSQQPYKKG